MRTLLMLLGFLAFNALWIWGGIKVAEWNRFTGPWAIYKGQLIVLVPLIVATLSVAGMAGAFSR